MKTIQTSNLSEATALADNDLIMISQRQNDGTYVSKKIRAAVINGSHVTVVDNYNANNEDTLLNCNANKDVTITLYSATGTNKTIIVTNVGSGRVFVFPKNGDFIRGDTRRMAINQTHTVTFLDVSYNNWGLAYNDT